MKAILYFVSSGIVREAHREAATAINAKTNKRVVFRNSTVADGEKAEENEGVAGEVIPANYERFSRYNDKGTLVEEGRLPDIATSAASRKLNVIGLPDGEGCPEDRDGIKEALEAEGVEFHGNAKTEKLVELYLAHFYPDSRDESEPKGDI